MQGSGVSECQQTRGLRGSLSLVVVNIKVQIPPSPRMDMYNTYMSYWTFTVCIYSYIYTVFACKYTIVMLYTHIDIHI